MERGDLAGNPLPVSGRLMVMRHAPLAAALILALSACSGDATPAPDSTTVPSTPSPGDAGAIEVRRFDVDGAEVWTRTPLAELPEQASIVTFTTTLIDSGDGPEACLGGVAESLPPQCSGPVVDGLEFGLDWSDNSQGIVWGDRTITVSWPPVDGRLTLIEDRPAEPFVDFDPVRFELPAECAGITDFVSIEDLTAWAASNPDRAGSPYVVDGGPIGVLPVKGDLEAIATELRTADAEPCLVSTAYSSRELGALQNELSVLFDAGLYVIGTSSGNIYNQVTVDLAVADASTVRQILEFVDDPGMIRVSGFGVILEGS